MATKKKTKKAKKLSPKKKKARRAKPTAKAVRRKTTRINMGFSVGTKKEAQAFNAKANRLTDGNLSLLIREAVQAFKRPSKKRK